jgi:serine/threonine protein kinase
MYVSPEYFNNKEISRGGDIYSFGLIMFRVLLNRLPYEDKDPRGIIEKLQKVNYLDHLKYSRDKHQSFKKIGLTTFQKN